VGVKVKVATFDRDSAVVVKSVEVIAGKWKVEIICHLFGATKRFSELRRHLPNCTQRMLTLQLRELEEDGLDHRVDALGTTVNKLEHQRELLRIAGLLAHVSGGVSDAEHAVLSKLATTFQLAPAEVDAALDAVKSALA